MLLDDFKNAKGAWVRSVKVDGHQLLTVSGSKWKNLIARCKVGGYEQIMYPGYVGCSNAFQDFDVFTDWSIEQEGYNQLWHLDKDMLFKNNKIYSENTCVFLPGVLNTFLIKCDKARGLFPIGVSWNKAHEMYVAQCNDGRKKYINLGYYDTPKLAFNAYKVYKESRSKALALQWAGKVDQRVVEALNTYEVEIDD